MDKRARTTWTKSSEKIKEMQKVSKPFTVPKAPEILYRNELYKMIKAMIKDYKSILGIYQDKQEQVAMDAEGTWLITDVNKKLDELGRKWGKNFEIFAKAHSKKFVEKMLRLTNTQIKQVMKDWFADNRLELFGQVIPSELKQIMNANMAYNVSLIKSIAPQYHDRVLGAVMRSVNGGGSLKQLTIEIARYGGMEMRRAKLIAADQTAKVYNNLILHDCKRLGAKKMKWFHTGAREPRILHITKFNGDYSNYPHVNGLNGLVFDIDNPPVIQEKKGKQPEIRGYPSDLPFCHCSWRSVFEE